MLKQSPQALSHFVLYFLLRHGSRSCYELSLSTAKATKSILSTSRSFTTSPRDNPFPSEHQGPTATPPPPVSPPITVSVHPLPHPSYALETLSQSIRTILHTIYSRYNRILLGSNIFWKPFTLNQEEYDLLQNAQDRLIV
jgi:hypothetical protein